MIEYNTGHDASIPRVTTYHTIDQQNKISHFTLIEFGLVCLIKCLVHYDYHFG